MTRVQNRRLGRSELFLSALGLGCWQFSQGGGFIGRYWPSLGETAVREIVATSLAGGINWFDTAEAYGRGQSERALARALASLDRNPGSVAVATKWWPWARSADSLTRTIGQRIDCLKPYPIDLYQIHQPYSLSSLNKQMDAMADLVQQGKIRHAGVSNFSAAQMRKAHDALQKLGIPLVSNQVKYSLLDRRIETNGVLKTAKELGIAIIAYSPLEQGLLSGRFHDREPISGLRRLKTQFRPAQLRASLPLIEQLREIAGRHGKTASQVALNWLVHRHGETIFAIPGASNTGQAKANTEALTFSLDPEQMEHIDRVSMDVWQGR
ncbi:MAG: aldo/keto reductase [Bacilli bacterium]